MGDHGKPESELGDRAITYAERAVEGVVMPSWGVADGLVPLAHSGELEAAQTGDMEAVKRLIATAFVMGWEARAEEPRRRARALGGVGEAATRRARHGERRPRRRPVED